MQDFERNIRAVSGGGGLIRASPRARQASAIGPRSRPDREYGRNADLDAIATYLALGVRAPIAPAKSNVAMTGPRTLRRRRAARTATAGATGRSAIWISPRRRRANEIVDAQLIRFLCRVGTFDPALFSDGVSNEIRANNAANVQARGILGFNVPSLISVFASAPYLHSGAAPTLEAVLENVTHRRVGRVWPGHPDQCEDRQELVSSSSRSIAAPSLSRPGAPPGGVCGAL